MQACQMASGHSRSNKEDKIAPQDTKREDKKKRAYSPNTSSLPSGSAEWRWFRYAILFESEHAGNLRRGMQQPRSCAPWRRHRPRAQSRYCTLLLLVFFGKPTALSPLASFWGQSLPPAGVIMPRLLSSGPQRKLGGRRLLQSVKPGAWSLQGQSIPRALERTRDRCSPFIQCAISPALHLSLTFNLQAAASLLYLGPFVNAGTLHSRLVAWRSRWKFRCSMISQWFWAP